MCCTVHKSHEAHAWFHVPLCLSPTDLLLDIFGLSDGINSGYGLKLHGMCSCQVFVYGAICLDNAAADFGLDKWR